MNLNDLKIKISERISDYLEFNTEEIFDQGDYIAIFGGAVRDSIADMDINDVDIICMSKSAKNLAKYIIEKHDYKQYDLYNKDGKMFGRDRTMKREQKLLDRGWKQIDKNDIQKNRQLKLTELNFKPEYKYEIWTEKETKNDDIDDDGFNFFDLPF